jgi:hypothetical protein
MSRWAPDVLAGDEWQWHHRRGTRTAEQRLCEAVLLGAVADLRRGHTKRWRWHQPECVHCIARQWILGGDAPFPFAFVCSALGVQEEVIRRVATSAPQRAARR